MLEQHMQESNYMQFIFAGFLNANVDRFSKSPANYGLMDILAALHWIQENIEAFGGDNKSVTLAGHGSGAACVHYLIASQAVPERVLFHKAILMSGVYSDNFGGST